MISRILKTEKMAYLSLNLLKIGLSRSCELIVVENVENIMRKLAIDMDIL